MTLPVPAERERQIPIAPPKIKKKPISDSKGCRSQRRDVWKQRRSQLSLPTVPDPSLQRALRHSQNPQQLFLRGLHCTSCPPPEFTHSSPHDWEAPAKTQRSLQEGLPPCGLSSLDPEHQQGQRCSSLSGSLPISLPPRMLSIFHHPVQQEHVVRGWGSGGEKKTLKTKTNKKPKLRKVIRFKWGQWRWRWSPAWLLLTAPHMHSLACLNVSRTLLGWFCSFAKVQFYTMEHLQFEKVTTAVGRPPQGLCQFWRNFGIWCVAKH